MNLEEMIYKRQSIRDYQSNPLDQQDLQEISEFIEKTKVLNCNIKWTYDIVSNDKITSLLKWNAPHYLLLFSEVKENYKENIGFIFQQVDLYLQSRGIGSCWLGMIKPNKNYRVKHENMEYVIGLSFGKTNCVINRNLMDFKRKKLNQISDYEDETLKPIQYAPSAVNSQPWYVTHENDGSFNIYRQKLGLIKRKTVGKWNQIDIGIALAHIYIANKESFEFYENFNHIKLKNYIYEGTFKV